MAGARDLEPRSLPIRLGTCTGGADGKRTNDNGTGLWRLRAEAGGTDGQGPVRRHLGAAWALETRPQPDHGSGPDRDEPDGATALPHSQRDQERGDQGRDDRSRHAPGLLRRVAQRDERPAADEGIACRVTQPDEKEY